MPKKYAFFLSPQYTGLGQPRDGTVSYQITFFDDSQRARGGFTIYQSFDGSVVYADQFTIVEPVPDELKNLSLADPAKAAFILQQFVIQWDTAGLFDAAYPDL